MRHITNADVEGSGAFAFGTFAADGAVLEGFGAVVEDLSVNGGDVTFPDDVPFTADSFCGFLFLVILWIVARTTGLS